ncbi:hypothetical protein M2103_001923 [Ereboglobus sp. PH5-5]|uniref:hypothetical protein n=1 Tax=Ereboglobus sp. PH5-5 TaxID=2940529 RepID=UPI0024074648|nr:hypothetical protein [Ereboglobus sp. PH5-5]MDF9833691.1 hypothetical protein [Ereboglobus sp. PH5-5]
MKFHTMNLPLLTVLPVVLLSGVVCAQNVAPRLAAPLVIPAAPTTTRPVATKEPVREAQVQLPVQAAPQPAKPAPQISMAAPSAPVAQTVSTPTASVQFDDGLGELMKGARPYSDPRSKMKSKKTSIPGPGGTEASQLRDEMIMRMKRAVEQIASEYGNPTFAQVFTNDAVQAQVLRKRVQMLHRMETIRTEIAALQKQKEQVRAEVDASQHELIALQQQAEALTNRLQKARFALGSISN